MKLAGFRADEHKELEDFDAIPGGEYIGKITESEQAQTKSKNGHFLKLTFQITQGEFKERKLWSNLNLDNPSAKAVEIANRELATIMKACGKVAVEESEDLHGIEMTLKVVEKAKTANYPASNEIKNYSPLSGVAVPSNSAKSGTEEKAKKKSRVSF